MHITFSPRYLQVGSQAEGHPPLYISPSAHSSSKYFLKFYEFQSLLMISYLDLKQRKPFHCTLLLSKE
uniref:Uncharacterized protein n=1 Tax=Meloidogyne enterolobii TaxID=390850 RepID=A0A6V7WI82_MELEN|nr:unnamed protein product [Meloidogyne enterolobii]